MIVRRLRLWCLLFLVGIGSATIAYAHEIRPGLLDITERNPGWFDVTWKVPTRGNAVLAIKPVLPKALSPIGPKSRQATPGAIVERSTYKSDGRSLVGATISIDGLEALQTDVMLRINLLQGGSHQAILRPFSATFQIPERESKVQISWSYLRMGVAHILQGVDHLLFVLALLLLVKGVRRVVATVTAFTLAHSITLAGATLGFVHMPGPTIEAIIALSIVFVAMEIVHARQGRPGIAERRPWIVAFAFGLLHGFGFAGALAEVGLPDNAIPLALLFFNLGVEAGQLLFIAAVLAAAVAWRWLRAPWPDWAWRMPTYGIGALAAFWTIERVVALLPA